MLCDLPSIDSASPGPGDLAARVASGPGFWTDWLAELDRQGLLEDLLADGVIAQALRETPAGHRYDRVLTAKMTVICVLVACLFPGDGYDTVLAMAFGLPGLRFKPGAEVPAGSAFSQARRLLGEQAMGRVFELDAERGDAALGITALWKGLEVSAIRRHHDGAVPERNRSPSGPSASSRTARNWSCCTNPAACARAAAERPGTGTQNGSPTPLPGSSPSPSAPKPQRPREDHAPAGADQAAGPPGLPGREIASLYAERWQVETAFLHLKKTVRGPRRALRGQSPDLARQEAWALLLIHNIVATATARAAAEAGTDPRLIPFTAVLG
jgi:Insertion element 4 transposase N-terminal